MSTPCATPQDSGPNIETATRWIRYAKMISEAHRLLDAMHKDFRDVQQVSQAIKTMEEMMDKLRKFDLTDNENDDDPNVDHERLRGEHEALLREMEISLQKLKNREQTWRHWIPKRAIQALATVGGSVATGTAMRVAATAAFGPGPGLMASVMGNVIGARVAFGVSEMITGPVKRYWETTAQES